MGDPRKSIVGRGAALNPRNRFERIEVDPGELDPGTPPTIYLRDHTRSIITRNDSPDVGFDTSLNPYRGCEHGCVYCISGDTPILMADGAIGCIRDVRVGDEIYGTARKGRYRHYVKTRVLAHWSVDKPAYRVTLEDGTCLIASGDHRFLTERGWKFVSGAGCGNGQGPHLTENNKLIGTGAFAPLPQKDREYKTGYLCGLIRGDEHRAFYLYRRAGRAPGNIHRLRLALADKEALQQAAQWLLDFGVATTFQKAFANRGPVEAICTQAGAHVDRTREIIAWRGSPSAGWRRGFLAGIFDAEGSYENNTLRIHNSDPGIIECVIESLRTFGFRFAIEVSGKDPSRPMSAVRIRGGLGEHLRFFHSVAPAISRKRDIEGIVIKSNADLRVSETEPLGVQHLFDVTTGTGDFIAGGVVSHNCYARPTHEYLGFSAGLDFESRIMVKEDAPELLQKQLSSQRWKPQALAMSGVTDPYQPVERKLGITRRCLEVLAEFRNPVAVITKNHLVTRDVDLLSELARHDAASVAISLTTLDDDLRRVMEPRTSQPSRRLAAIRKLAAAGVPVGVMTAPVIPGLTDHELPALLSAASEAGASFAAYTTLRLPYAVRPLFEDWLSRTFPDRKEKVLNRIRELRGGKLNDSRFGHRMVGEGFYAEHIARLFEISCRRSGIGGERDLLSTAAFRRPPDQPALFD